MNRFKNIKSGKDVHSFLSQGALKESDILVIIEDIRSGNDTHFELDKFYFSFDRYEELLNKKKLIQKEIAQLENDLIKLKKRKKITEIDQKQKQMRVDILNLALTIHKSRDSEKLREVKLLFGEGKLAGIDNAITKEYLLNQQKISQLSVKLVDNSNEFLVKAQVTNLDYDRNDRFEKAIYFFDKGLMSAERAKDNEHLGYYYFDYGSFLSNHKHYSNAILNYEKARTIYQDLSFKNKTIYQVYFADALANLGVLYEEINEFEKANRFYNEALSIYENTFQTLANYNAWIRVLINKGGFLDKRNMLDEAKKCYETAINLILNIKGNSLDVDFIYAGALQNLAALHFKRNNFKTAIKEYHLSLEVLFKLESNETYLSGIAKVYSNLAMAYQAINNLNDAELFYLKSLEIREKQSELNPEAFKFELAISLEAIGTFYGMSKNFGKGIDFLNRSISILRDLNEVDLDAFLFNLGKALNNIGNLYSNINLLDKAFNFFKESETIRRNLSENNAGKYNSDLALTLFNFANNLNQLGQVNNAEAKYKECVEIRKSLALDNPEIYNPEIANTFINLSLTQKALGKINEAIESNLEAIRLHRNEYLGVGISYNFLSYFTIALNNLGEIYKEKDEYYEAKKFYLEAIELQEKLVEKDFFKNANYLALFQRNLGRLEVRFNNSELAEKYFQASIGVYKNLRQKDLKYNKEIAPIVSELANLYYDMRMFKESEKADREALTIYKEMVSNGDKHYLKDLAIIYGNLASSEANSKNYNQAERNYNESLFIYKKIARENPGKYKIDIGVGAMNLARFYTLEKSDKLKALASLKEAVKALAPYVQTSQQAQYQMGAVGHILNHWNVNLEDFSKEIDD